MYTRTAITLFNNAPDTQLLAAGYNTAVVLVLRTYCSTFNGCHVHRPFLRRVFENIIKRSSAERYVLLCTDTLDNFLYFTIERPAYEHLSTQ